MRRPSPLSWALATAALGSAAHAQALPGADGATADPAASPTQQVIVTATRSGKALDKIPGAVAVISRQDIDTQSLVSEDPSALLAAQVPGYAPSRQKLSSFGEGLRGRNALLLLDGIPQTNPLRYGGREGYFADALIIDRILHLVKERIPEKFSLDPFRDVQILTPQVKTELGVINLNKELQASLNPAKPGAAEVKRYDDQPCTAAKHQ